jgi:lysophospholipase L1-like esterase
MVFRVSLGGSRLRVHLANTFGTTPLVIGAAHIGLHTQGPDIAAGSDRALWFDGKGTATIPPGAEMISDPVELTVPALAEVAVSVFVPGPTGVLSGHSMALQATYMRDGDSTRDASLADATTTQAWYWVSAVDVTAPPDAATIVAFGDSITDGATSTPGTNGSWPSRLAERLAANPATAHLSVVNQGISGNRVLADGAGVSALARFDRDVLGAAGVRWLMLLEGINDIGQLGRGGTLDPDALISAMKQLITRAHTHGIKVIGCTLTPYGGAGYATETGEELRARLNEFIRTSRLFDAVVDFDAATRDPGNPRQLLPAYNNTDHLHPNDAGYRAMANAIDLAIFTR